MKILICEDDLSTLAIIKHILSKYSSLELIIATSGRQAHRFIHKPYYDLILTTISMPYHSGLEIIEYVRKVKKSAVPIIVLSIEGYDEAVLHAFRLGANEVILKPFNPEVLIAKIHKYLKLEKH
jgi:DNA-binding response OmpR family regulator